MLHHNTMTIGYIPQPAEIIARRTAAGLTQTQAANLVYVMLRAWQRWEAGDREMSAAHWELFCLKTQGLRG